MVKQIYKALLIFTIIFNIQCNNDSLHTMDRNKCICINIASNQYVSPISPYEGLETHFDYISRRSFAIKNNYIELIDKSKSDLIESIGLIIILSNKFEGLYSGEGSGDTFSTVIPFSFNYTSEFWVQREKANRIEMDYINDSIKIYCKNQQNTYVVKPGDSIVLQDTAYDTIWDPYSGYKNVLYAHQRIKTDSIYNYGYLYFR